MEELVNRDQLAKFEFSEESLNDFRKNRDIPIDLYDQAGKIIAHRKKNPTEEDFGNLLKIELQGAYYLISEAKKSRPGLQKIDPHNVKLFDADKTAHFAKQTALLIDELKKESFSNNHATRISKSVNTILDDFTSNPDFESGLFNILEILSAAGVPLDAELLAKRTIVAMGMKVRIKKIVTTEDNKPDKKEHLSIMTASYLADIGHSKINIPDRPDLPKEEFLAVQQHPILSYLMTLSASDVSTEIRTLVLNHHRPFRGTGLNNNFPDPKNVFSKLMIMRDKFVKDISRAKIVADIEEQLRIQESNVTPSHLEENIAILSLASEYAALTSNHSWRPAYSSSMALKMILNDSFFSYSNKNIRLLLDYVGASLSNNVNIINLGDYVITASIDSEKRAHFDICQIVEVDRFQTRPKIQRICTIKPIFKHGNQYKISDFDTNDIRMDIRRAIVDLANQTSNQRIIYIVDPALNEPLFESVKKIH